MRLRRDTDAMLDIATQIEKLMGLVVPQGFDDYVKGSGSNSVS